ncbi:LysR substrate-binding domain-containing protein [Ruegeria lacuscaerulensis]|uniref:LysR substrate-binding domain-containing protein n=1 Tax=Ruegeria lacuscaerulensis TaxID=55218 RepID=UPI001479B220|nr:LysR substrate-binding domain-containing protein [Ruegeria lacuscaerulensis]
MAESLNHWDMIRNDSTPRHITRKPPHPVQRRFMLTFRQVEAFRCVYLTGSTTSAAKLLGVSQPAVSRLLGELERELDLTLFERAGRRLAKTQEADALYEEVQRSYLGLERIKEAAESIRDYPHGKICLVAIPTVESTIGLDLVAQFKREYPRASASLEVLLSDQACEWVSARQANIAVAYPYSNRPGLNVRVVDTSPAVCALSADHRLASCDIINAEDLQGESFVSYRPDSLLRLRIDQVFRERGVARDIRLECRATASVFGMVARGMGVAVVGPHQPPPNDGSVIIRPFKPEIPVELAVIWPKGANPTTLESKMLEIIETYFGVSITD